MKLTSESLAICWSAAWVANFKPAFGVAVGSYRMAEETDAAACWWFAAGVVVICEGTGVSTLTPLSAFRNLVAFSPGMNS